MFCRMTEQNRRVNGRNCLSNHLKNDTEGKAAFAAICVLYYMKISIYYNVLHKLLEYCIVCLFLLSRLYSYKCHSNYLTELEDLVYLSQQFCIQHKILFLLQYHLVQRFQIVQQICYILFQQIFYQLDIVYQFEEALNHIH